MLRLSSDPTPYRVVGIDPGTDTLGICCLEIDLENLTVALADVRTLRGSLFVRSRRTQEQVHGARFARLDGLQDALVEYFFEHCPNAVIAESSFFNPRRPGSFSPLVEGMSMIRHALIRYNDWLPLRTIDPASAKAKLGVSGKSSDKELVQKAVLKLTGDGTIANPRNISIETLDEHSADAIAVGYHLVNKLLVDFQF